MEITVETAKQRAREDAANKIVPLIIARSPELGTADPNWLVIRLRQELTHHKFIKDEFLQTMSTPVVGTTVSPGIFETLELLGREEALRRMDAALDGT